MSLEAQHRFYLFGICGDKQLHFNPPHRKCTFRTVDLPLATRNFKPGPKLFKRAMKLWRKKKTRLWYEWTSTQMLRKYIIYPIRNVFIVVILYCILSGGRKSGKLSRAWTLSLVFLIGCRGASGSIPFVRRFANIPRDDFLWLLTVSDINVCATVDGCRDHFYRDHCCDDNYFSADMLLFEDNWCGKVKGTARFNKTLCNWTVTNWMCS